MVAGDVVVLTNALASGYHNGQIGLVVKVEQIGITYEICWVLMPDGEEVPFWPKELKKIDEGG
jgi:hypothetical protein